MYCHSSLQYKIYEDRALSVWFRALSPAPRTVLDAWEVFHKHLLHEWMSLNFCRGYSTPCPGCLSSRGFAVQLVFHLTHHLFLVQLQFSSFDSAMETCTPDDDDRVSPWILQKLCIRKLLLNGALHCYGRSMAQPEFTINGVRQWSRE